MISNTIQLYNQRVRIANMRHVHNANMMRHASGGIKIELPLCCLLDDCRG